MDEYGVKIFRNLRSGDELRAPNRGAEECINVFRDGKRIACICEMYAAMGFNRMWLQPFIMNITDAMIACGWPYDIVHTHFLDSEGARVESDDDRVSSHDEIDAHKVDELDGWTWVFTVKERE